MKKIMYITQNGKKKPVYPEEIEQLKKKNLLPKEWKGEVETKQEKKPRQTKAKPITSKSINEGKG